MIFINSRNLDFRLKDERYGHKNHLNSFFTSPLANALAIGSHKTSLLLGRRHGRRQLWPIQRWRVLGTGEERLDLDEKSRQKHTQCE